MTVTAGDLGTLGDLATALGLVDAGGDFNGDWLNEPGTFLARVLADDTQRGALISFVDEVLGGSERVTDPSGLVWLPVFERHEGGEPGISIYVVLDDKPTDHVRIGVGATVSSSDATASVKAHVPLFRTAKLNHAAAPDPVILGTADGVIALDVAITINDPTIKSVALTARVPTEGSAPTLGMTLQGLQLPGAPQPRDLTLSLDDLAALEHDFLDLLVGLVQAQAAAIGAGPLASFAGLLGLREGGAVPALPVQDVVAHGASALTAWFESVVREDTTRAAWLQELAGLLGGARDGDAVAFTLGPARLRVGARADTSNAGHSAIVAFVAAEVGAQNGDAIASVEADLLSIDLGTQTAIALPIATAGVVLGRRAGGAGTALLTGDPAVDRMVFGFRLDQNRKPVLHLAAEGASIGGQPPTDLDLSSPDAIAQAAATVVSQVVDDLISQLGPVGDVVKTLLGLSPPPGFPAVPTLDLAKFLQDPLGAVANYWHTLLTAHADTVPAVLEVLRDVVVDASQAATAISGTGTESDPWRVTIVSRVELQAWVTGDVLTIAIGGASSSTTSVNAALGLSRR